MLFEEDDVSLVTAKMAAGAVLSIAYVITTVPESNERDTEETLKIDMCCRGRLKTKFS